LSADPGTFGERVVTLMCKRLAFEADPTDVSRRYGIERRVKAATFRPMRGDDRRDLRTARAPRCSDRRGRSDDQTDALQAYLTSDAVLSLSTTTR